MILSNKVTLVTGGSRGLGRIISLNLANAGALVILTYHTRRHQAERVVQQILHDGGKALALQMDVCDRRSVRKVIGFIKKKYKKLDVLVNNAGINQPADFDKIKDKDWDKVLAVNLKGPFICIQESLFLLKKSAAGSIINIGSVSGQYGGPRTVHYAVSKAGLISLSQVVARFVANYNIRCNTIAVGLIKSEMANKGLKSLAVSKLAENILLKRLGTAQEVATAVLFLAANDSSYITAQTINVNGGLYF
ncbi:MAG: SDR family oxidoreductase [Candidatus Omnitrophota bacterium]